MSLYYMYVFVTHANADINVSIYAYANTIVKELMICKPGTILRKYF